MASPGEDSRTRRIGRKRALQDSSQQSREVISLLDSSDDESEPERKRPRQQSATNSGATFANGEVDLTTSPGQASNPQSLAVLESFTNGPGPTWNKGVQGGLRISFGTKNRASTISESTPRQQGEAENENDGNTGNGISTTSLDTYQNNRATASGSLATQLQQTKAVSFASEPKREPRTRSKKQSSGPEDSQQTLPARPKEKAKKEKGPEKKKDKRENKLQSATNTADQAIDRFGWPLPRESGNIMTAISGGKTWYPCSPGQPCIYQFENFKFPLTEVLNEEGKPIRVQDITLPVFAQSFLEENMDVVDRVTDGKLTDKRLSAAFNNYISRYYSHCIKFFNSDAKEVTSSVHDMVKKAKDSMEANPNRLKKRAVAKAPLLVSSDDYYKLENEASAILPKSDVSDVEDTGMNVVDDDDDEEEVEVIEVEEAVDEVENELLHKYFPPTPANYPRQRCVTCASSRHTTKHCPELTCSSCGLRGLHLTSACPKTLRCLKCSTTGHRTQECPEKLRAIQTEVKPCEICKSTVHVENQCHHIWRTYKPKEKIKKVRHVRVDCYSCGAEGHYGPECGLYQGKLLSGGMTWSRSNLHLYLDSSSQDRAISVGVDYSIPNRAPKSFSIKGKANDPILLDGSNSDEEGTFLRSKVPRAPPKHGIIVMAQAQNRDRSYQNDQSLPDRLFRGDSARYGQERTFSPPPEPNFGEYQDFPGHFPAQAQYSRRPDNSATTATGSSRNAMNFHGTGDAANSSTATKKRARGGSGGRGGAIRGRGRKRASKNDSARMVTEASSRRR